MTVVFKGLDCIHRAARGLLFAVLAVIMVGCGGLPSLDVGGFLRDDPPAQDQQAQLVPGAQAPVPGQPIGTGAAKVALLLPLTGAGQTAQVGTAMKQAAELALFDFGQNAITLVQKDTGGTPQGAERAAQAALAEGAELILGPLLVSEVASVAPVARTANVPVIAFSTVGSVAGQGVYLMSFLPEEEVSNIVRHAVSTGRKNIAAIIPQSQYGTIIETALNASASRHGAEIVAVERYPRSVTGVNAPAARLAAAINTPSRRIQAVMIPEGGQMLNALSNAFQQGGLAPNKIQVLGTGLWDDPSTKTIPIAVNGLYAGVDPAEIVQFENRYQQAYGGKPPRLASLTYDAVSLAVALANDQSLQRGQRFTQQRITNAQGFKGVNGLFRFRADGKVERGLAILQVTATGTSTAAPGASRFNEGL